MIEKINRKNAWLILKTLLFVLLIIIVKLIFHYNKLELISINNLFSGIIAANVFLMGFLLSGVLSDFKESEKIPGEISSSLSSIYDEILNTYLTKNKDKYAKEGLDLLYLFSLDIEKWLYKKIKTRELLLNIRNFYSILNEIEKIIQPNYIVRLKNELANLKKIIIRTDTIRDTNFISSGYLIATVITILMSLGLILSKIEPFYESLFFVGIISFLMLFLLLLIHDLDNPFGYYEKSSTENVSLYPLIRLKDEIKETNNSIGIE